MRAALGLGSNLGDRRQHLDRALLGLKERVFVREVSTYHETEPVGGPGQGRYLNAAVVVETAMEPRELLELAHDLERAAGRTREVRWGPRTLDVDILLCDERVLEEADLTIPHPRLAERRFVLAPLAEVAPCWRVPGAGRTVKELHEDQRIRG